MKKHEVITYDYEDMLRAQNMTNSEAVEWLNSLDRGYFNQYTYFDEKDEFKEYSEYDYSIFCMNIALDKAIRLLQENDRLE